MMTDVRSTLTFNEDGTIDREQLAGYPQELIDEVTDPVTFRGTAPARPIALDIRRQHALATNFASGSLPTTREKAILETRERAGHQVSAANSAEAALRRIVRKISLRPKPRLKGMRQMEPAGWRRRPEPLLPYSRIFSALSAL